MGGEKKKGMRGLKRGKEKKKRREGGRVKKGIGREGRGRGL